MKTTHTPGPWTVDRMHLGSSPDRRSGFVVNGPDSQPLPVRICDLRCAPESPFDQTQANARLIAAAPELLAALQAVEARLTAAARAFYVDGKRNALEAAFSGWKPDAEQARAAIAKASA